MHSKAMSLVLKAVVAILPFTLLAGSAGAATEKVLYSFKGKADGGNPRAGLVMDKAGNLYGTKFSGGSYGFGAIFELSPGPSGTWTETTIHSFSENGADGWDTQTGLIIDASGNLYGANTYGGSTACPYGGCGTVFELSPPAAGGQWTEKVFSFGSDNWWPSTGLAIDAKGDLFGETQYGGTDDEGGVYELTPAEGGGWTESVLYNFDYRPATANTNPLILDAAGNLYGTTILAGIGAGTVFELSPQGGGVWTHTILHDFGKGSDGFEPDSILAFDSSGNLYGETGAGGNSGDGIVFEMTPKESGGWTERVLHDYPTEANGGQYPGGGLTFDGKGNFYGTAEGGGPNASSGTDEGGEIFEFMPTSSGGWTSMVLHDFGKGLDGQFPNGGLVIDASGNIYGTTQYGGVYRNGTVFEIVP